MLERKQNLVGLVGFIGDVLSEFYRDYKAGVSDRLKQIAPCRDRSKNQSKYGGENCPRYLYSLLS